MKANSPASAVAPGLNEVRFSLREMLVEVQSELQSGVFGQQKLRQEEVRKMFKVHRRSRRAKRN
jgi:hypothetical protein